MFYEVNPEREVAGKPGAPEGGEFHPACLHAPLDIFNYSKDDNFHVARRQARQKNHEMDSLLFEAGVAPRPPSSAPTEPDPAISNPELHTLAGRMSHYYMRDVSLSRKSEIRPPPAADDMEHETAANADHDAFVNANAANNQ